MSKRKRKADLRRLEQRRRCRVKGDARRRRRQAKGRPGLWWLDIDLGPADLLAG